MTIFNKSSVCPYFAIPTIYRSRRKGSWSMSFTKLFSSLHIDVDPVMSAISDSDSRVLKQINNVTTRSNFFCSCSESA